LDVARPLDDEISILRAATGREDREGGDGRYNLDAHKSPLLREKKHLQ
jgi:hypothetical protein